MSDSEFGGSAVNARAVVAAHLAAHRSVLDRVESELSGAIAEVAAVTLGVLRSGGKLLFCGNGGSAADAQHLAAEYVVRFSRERRPLPALALTTDTSILTAAGNDYGFERVFERQVRALGRPGDLLVLHSTSGESLNLVQAARAGREVGLRTVGFLGKGGGRLAQGVDMALVVPGTSTAVIQEMHLMIGHIVCDIVEASFTDDRDAKGVT